MTGDNFKTVSDYKQSRVDFYRNKLIDSPAGNSDVLVNIIDAIVNGDEINEIKIIEIKSAIEAKKSLRK